MVMHYRHAIALFLILLLAACSDGRDSTTLEGPTMGTTWSITVSGSLQQDRQTALHREIQERLESINRSMSTWIEDSELSRINRSRESGWIEVSDGLYNVLGKAMEISHLTGGAFDITVGPLVNLWGFGPGGGKDRAPAAEKIRTTLQETGYDKLKLGISPPSIRKKQPALYLDLSGIAKGYAVDELAGLLKSKGITEYMVEIGGEIKTGGNNPDGEAWRIGIEKPVAGQRSAERIIRLRNKAMATSGDYRNYFEQDGVRYSHTIDPRNGYPVRHNLASVTVLHDSAMTADALATALLVMGPTDGLEFATRHSLPAFFIIKADEGFIERHTDEIKSHLVPEKTQ